MEAALVSYAEGSLKTVLGKLGDLLAQRAVKLWGARDDIQELKDELESMNSFIRKNARKEDPDDQLKTWMKQVREMAYDIEDCIDEFLHRVGDPIEGGCLQYPHRGIRLVRTLKACHETVSKIQSLKTRVRSVSERHSRYEHLVSTQEIPGSVSSCVDPRFHAFFLKQSEGIEDRTEKLVRLLMDSNVPDLRVISLFGYGGLGKTTLAMTAYENPRVKNDHFQCRAQISLSQKFNLNAILRDILKQISRNSLQNIENWNENDLVRKLKDQLENKRYVIIIDDIWTQSAWDSIKSAFPNSKNGSRIVVTTRIKSVAESCSSYTHDYIYQIEALSEKESEDLFFKKTFGVPYCCHPELTNVSKDILRKCGGMPLAIVSIAGLLSVKPNKSEPEWKKVYDSIGSELETNPSLEGINKILSLSYNDLPYHLKTCFLYLSIFPEDYKIRRKRLVRRWIAEGFVSEKWGLSEEQVAESYFDEFVNRNLIQSVDFRINGKIKNCRVHDMILELIVSKSVEENFVSLIGDQYTLIACDKVRRLSVQSPKQNFTKFGLYHARSLTLFVDQTYKSISWSSFRVLRVLDLEHSNLKNSDLNNVGELFLLKYLGLSRNFNLYELPTQIGKLQHLETLDIRHTYISRLPKGVSSLRSLKHLECSFDSSIYQLNLENMGNLETLTGVQFGIETSKSLEKMKHLKKLGFKIPVDRNEELLDLKLSPNLYYLKLISSGGSIPNCIDSLQYLVKLRIRGLILTEIGMQKLGTLPRLLSLKLYYLQFPSDQERKIYFRRNLFKYVKSLELFGHNKCQVIFEEATAPDLERLTWSYELSNRDGIEGIIGMEHLPKLKVIQIMYDETKPSFVDRTKAAADAHPNHPNFIIERNLRRP
ncbi:hypothetical protein LUZ60_011551 [Juncus effusus]|nr:hypothetical protein LUZ60_011551 [Juncus effusus]